ncbi:alpha/beta fold hydrolase [Methylobacterium sp. J-077]|uniref:alpha/beta fold hydrolase n=1 Tax=Methylobacterium sp. J-077 TaxID=2836656 RepID=UPI001FBB393A|nr:alpha/beta fold hydrolase [Methylobacterium sp. J-077]MCJ2121883.1 alpha/beta hydrolase [Methylobacterium sp. J-077]
MMRASATTSLSQTVELADGSMHYLVDDFTDPWVDPDTVVLMHGIAEEAAIWRAWVPHLARTYRVIRVDLRGFGASSPLPEDRPFNLADWADDIEQLIASLGSSRVHIVGTKLGSLVAFALAQRGLPTIKSMTLAGVLASPSGSLARWVEAWIDLVEQGGVEAWARATMPGRMGDNLSPDAIEWWTKTMGSAPASTVIRCFRLLPGIPEPPNPEGVRCPTLFLAAGGEAFVSGSFDQRPDLSAIENLRQRVANGRLECVTASSYHIAATHPDQCAIRARDFLDRVSS